MRFATITLLIALATYAAAADQARILHLHTSAANIVVDGVIDAAWAKADSATGFFQLAPYYNQHPSFSTVAKLLTDGDALYCLIVCEQPPAEIQLVKGLLDQGQGDGVSVMLDTFNDRQSAYRFAVTAAGVRADCRLVDDGRNNDYSWDGVWFSAAQTYPWGYVVEMKIPFTSIRYDVTASGWGLDMDRWVAERKEDLYWNSYEQNEGMRISKFGRLEFDGFHPAASESHVEVYPVGLVKAALKDRDAYDVKPDAGVDVFYNPSEKLTFQFTANPDFAQIEADPFQFNISRYETYFSERRPFFTEGNEIFTASGRQSNTGFYRPMELLYTRRIGKLLPDGTGVPLIVGTKAFGRLDDWEYGGFYARTGERDYMVDDTKNTELGASFFSGRVKKQVLDNSSVGVLFVGKRTREGTDGVVDIDGAFRTSTWQLSYQIARSVQRGKHGDFAGSAALISFQKTWVNLVRLRAIGNDFEVNEVGYVPWKGSTEFVAITGPVWYYDTGWLKQTMIYVGGGLTYEHADLYADHSAIVGLNMQFRDNWGFEINADYGKNKDAEKRYTAYSMNLSSWFNISPRWSGNLYGGYQKTYNFRRDYLAFYTWAGMFVSWKAMATLEAGTSFDSYIEGNPDGGVEEVTLNARPYCSVTPLNNLNIRIYVDNLYSSASRHLDQVIGGLLFSYNFMPKSWVYLALNEVRNRSLEVDPSGVTLPRRMHVADRAGVVKVKYLYYF